MILQFGEEADRPSYIGMGNSFVAPMTILAPIFAGWIVDTISYQAAFIAAAAAGLVTMAILRWFVKDPPRFTPAPIQVLWHFYCPAANQTITLQPLPEALDYLPVYLKLMREFRIPNLIEKLH
jgi:MFS family permease